MLVLFAAAPPPAPDDVYVGLACRVAGADCGRVGLAVWLPRPADRVWATALGERIVLTTDRSGSGRYGFRRYWTGFARLAPARVRPGEAVRLHVTVVLAGKTRTATRAARVSSGWG
jgi:hypothetical protein